LRLDDQLVSDLDSLAEFLYSIKRIPNPVKAREMIDAAPLKAVRADLVKLP